MIRGEYNTQRTRCGEYDLFVAILAMAVHDLRAGIKGNRKRYAPEHRLEQIRTHAQQEDRNLWASYRSALWFFFSKESGFESVMSVVEVSTRDVLKQMRLDLVEALGESQAKLEIRAALSID